MDELRDRHGRAVEVTLAGAGKTRALSSQALEAALRLRRRLPPGRAPAEAAEKLFGLRPAELRVRLWNGRALAFYLPADVLGFLGDIDAIVLRDQYEAGRLGRGAAADAGANLGVFSLYALALGAGKVYAFEPVAETFALLKRNLALNRAGDRVKAFNTALGAAPGQAEIKFNTRGEGSAMIGGGDTINAGVSYSGRRQVRLAPLDALVKARLGFLKIDVEGYEKEVLAGAAGLIRRWRPALAVAAYHRPGDPGALRRTIAAIQPGYRARLAKWAEHDLCCDHRG